MINVKIVGKNLTFSPLKKRIKKEKSKRRYKNSNDEGLKLKVKIRKRWNRLLNLLNSLSDDPDWLMTLIYPKSFSSEDIVSRIKADVKKINNYIRCRYKNCWFIYSIEYSHKSKIHIHIIGKTGRKRINPWSKIHKKFENEIAALWERVVGLSFPKLTKVRYLKENEGGQGKGYLAKFEKKKYIRYLIGWFPRSFTFGIVYKKNLPIAKPLVFNISQRNFDKFIRPSLIKDARKFKMRPESRHAKKINLNSSGYHILNEKRRIENLLKKYGKEV